MFVGPTEDLIQHFFFQKKKKNSKIIVETEKSCHIICTCTKDTSILLKESFREYVILKV